MLQCPCHIPVSSYPIDALTHRVASALLEFCQDIDVHAALMRAMSISRETHTIVTISRETHDCDDFSGSTRNCDDLSGDKHDCDDFSGNTLVCSRAASCDTVD